MTTRRAELCWSSHYLDFDSWVYGEEADEILLRGVLPVVSQCESEGLIDRWFFVRYHDEGPHLRVRCRGREEDLRREWDPRIRAAADEQPHIRGVREIPYEPELDRYSGTAGLEVSEDLFHASSRAAAELLRVLPPGDRSARLGQAMLFQVVTLWAFGSDRDDVAEMAAAYGHGYLRALSPDPEQLSAWLSAFEAGLERQASHLADYLEATWEALEQQEPLTDRLDPWRRDLIDAVSRFRELCDHGELTKDGEPCASWPEVSGFLAASHLHMMNNRLGIDIREESYLSVLIHHTLRPAPTPG